jgi:hypothetical protein
MCFILGISLDRAVNNTVIKINQVMICKEKVAVCSEIRTNHSALSQHHVEFLNDKPGGM